MQKKKRNSLQYKDFLPETINIRLGTDPLFKF